MDSYVKAITLDVNADENYTIIKAKQGDKINRKIAITLKKDGANFTPTGVSQIWFRVQKPDKNIAIVKSTDSGNPISSAGNVYTVTLSEQCLTASGKAWCDLAFLDSSGNTLSSCAFILNIIPMPNGNTARSISEWTDLQQAIDDAERFASIVAFRTSGNYIQYTVDGTTWVNLTTVGAIGGDLQTQINALNGAITNGTLLDGMPQTGKNIPANSNLNDYTTAGTYWVQSDGDAATIANMPRAASGTLYVINRAAGNYKTQIYFPTTSIIMAYVRFCNAGTWTNWIMESDTNSNIAKVELTGQATQEYVVDDYVVVNGALYRVIAPISNGDAFSTGTNISSTNVTDEIGSVKNLFTEIKTKTQTITTSSGGYVSVSMNPRAIILSIFVIGTGDICVSFCTNAAATEKGAMTWWLTFRNVETWNVVASTQLNIGIVYIELS